jgi:hypothetical protein
MSLIVPYLSEQTLLDKMIKLSDEDFLLKLYKNDHTPTRLSVLGDFTEANFDDYSEVILERTKWNDAVLVSPVPPCIYNEAVSVYSESITWVCGVIGGSVYGMYVVGQDSGDLLWAERFFEAPQVLSEFDSLTITPKIKLRTQISC